MTSPSVIEVALNVETSFDLVAPRGDELVDPSTPGSSPRRPPSGRASRTPIFSARRACCSAAHAPPGWGVTVLPSIAAGTIPAGVRPVVAVDDPQPIGRSVVAVTPPERSPSALALLGARREEAALIAETTLHFLDA